MGSVLFEMQDSQDVREVVELAWADYQATTTSTFQHLWREKHFTDVTLACEDGQQVEAHRAILAACSNFFQNILLKQPHANPLNVPRGVEHEDLMLIVQYMYLGECKVGLDNLARFVEAGKELQIKGLYEQEEEEDRKHEEMQTESTLYCEVSETEELRKDIKHVLFVETFDLKEKNASGNKTEPEDTDQLECDICLKTFDKQYKHDYHKAKGQCNLRNPPKKMIKKENREGEKKPALFICELCPYTTKANIDLQDHIQVFHKGELFNCDQCDHKSKYRRQIEQHKQTKHEGIKYECSVCGASYGRNSHLQAHIERKHDNIKYACTQCDYTINRKRNLRVHVQMEHERRILFCSECDYQGVNPWCLNEHQKKYHGGIIYKCDFCDERFKTRFDLSHHRKFNLCTSMNI